MNEETKNIKMTLAQAREAYKQGLPFINSILLSNWTLDELTKPILPTSVIDLKINVGHRISSYGTTFVVTDQKPMRDCYRTAKEAQSAQAMAELSYLMHVYNEGWEPNWKNRIPDKFVIARSTNISTNELLVERRSYLYNYLTFKTEEIAKLFLNTFLPLIKQYYMI